MRPTQFVRQRLTILISKVKLSIATDIATYDETRLLPKNSYVIDYYSPLSFDLSNIRPNWCSLSANNFLSISFVW